MRWKEGTFEMQYFFPPPPPLTFWRLSFHQACTVVLPPPFSFGMYAYRAYPSAAVRTSWGHFMCRGTAFEAGGGTPKNKRRTNLFPPLLKPQTLLVKSRTWRKRGFFLFSSHEFGLARGERKRKGRKNFFFPFRLAILMA